MDEIRISPAGDGFYAAANNDPNTEETPHGCYEGWVYLGYLVEDETGADVEVVDRVPCRRCHVGDENL